MNYDKEPSEIIIYDSKSVRKLRGFLVQVLILLDERRQNPNKPEHYMDPVWDYDEIEKIIHLLDTSSSKNLALDPQTNKRLMEIYEAAKRHYYSRIMNLYRYYQDTDKLIMTCNGMNGSVRTNLLLVTGGPKQKTAQSKVGVCSHAAPSSFDPASHYFCL